MKTAIYPGSFDPVTYGHLDIIKRASRLVDRVIIGIIPNSSKSPLFSVEERLEMIKECIKDIDNVEVTSFEGLTINFAKQNDADVIIRGLRAVTDFEYEMQLAQANKTVAPEIETVFYVTSSQYSFLSSSIVRDVAKYGGDNSRFVPDIVVKKLKEKFSR